jgi:hypothetical protein
MVLGGPGSGKSFLTQITAIDLAQEVIKSVVEGRADFETLALPVHFTLTNFSKLELDADPTKAVLSLLQNEWAPAPCFLTWLAQRLRSRSTWLLLDALDEVPESQRSTLTDRLRALDGRAWQTRLLLTCRPANWAREQIPWPELTAYELAPLNPYEIRQFVGKWHSTEKERANILSQALDRNYPLAHAARTPLIATFLCLAHEEMQISTSTRRTGLYAHVVRGLARRAWKAKPLAKTDPHVDDVVRFLVRIARPLFQRHPRGNLFTHSEIAAELENAVPMSVVPLSALEARRAGQTMPPPETWPTLLRDELLESGILVGAGLRDGVETQFSFAHRSLLEYLVARNLNEEVNDVKAGGWMKTEPFIDKKSWHPAWQEVVVFLSGLLEDPVPLLALLANKETDDFTRQRLCLAGRCLPELSEKGMELYKKAAGIKE